MKYIILANTVLAGRGLEPIENGAVAVEGEKIIFVGSAEEALAAYPDAEIIRMEDKCIMPGMFECHNHLAMDARLEGHLTMMEQGELEHTILALNSMKDDLMSGVTTARCMGDRHYIDIKLKKMVAEGKVTGPDLLVSGIGMRSSNGHGFVGVPHSGPEEIRRTARDNMRMGADILKIFISPGSPVAKKGDFIPCFLSEEEVRVAADEARRNGRRSAAHCAGGEGLDICVKSGITVLEHLYSVTPEQVKLLEEEFDGWVDMTSGIALDETREPMLPPASAAHMRAAREYCIECVSQIYKNDKIKMTIGSDAYHGLLWKEVVYAVKYGCSPLRALKAVTSEAADMCGIAGKTGSLCAGLNADIIAVDSNPLEDVSVLKDVSFVMKRGTIYKKDGKEC